MGVETVLAIAASVGAIYNGEQQKKASAAANETAKKNAEAQAKAQDEATNKANQKTPDSNAILSSIQQAAKSGTSGTMLTGSQGVDPNSLNLGKSTLLGG